MLQARGEALEHAKAKAHAETLARQLQMRLDEIDAEDPMAPTPSAEAAAFAPLGAGRGVLPRVPVLASFVETLAETSRDISRMAEVTLKGMSKVEPLLISHLLEEELVEEVDEGEAEAAESGEAAAEEAAEAAAEAAEEAEVAGEAGEAEGAEEPNPDAPDGEPAAGEAPQDAAEEAAEAPPVASAEGAVAMPEMPPQAPGAGESALDDAPDAADSSTLSTTLGDTTAEAQEFT